MASKLEDKPYVSREDRIDLLIEAIDNTRELIQDGSDLTAKEYKAYLSELRMLSKEIREESVPFDEHKDQMESPFDKFMRKLTESTE